MIAELDKLIELQQTDTNLRRLKKQLDTADTRRAEIEQEFEQHASSIREIQGRQDSLNARRADLERQIEENKSYLTRAERNLKHAQNQKEYETAMRALHLMGYHAVGIGKQELGVPLVVALGAYSLNNPRPRPVAANLVGVEPDGVFNALNVRPYEIIEVKGLPKIGVVGMIGKTVQDAVKNDASLKFNPDGVPAALKRLAEQKTEFNVVLFQSDEKFASAAVPEVESGTDWCVKQKIAPLHVVLHTCHDPEPPGLPKDLNGTQLITVGHKGKYVGVLGVWRKAGGGFDYKYEMVLIGP